MTMHHYWLGFSLMNHFPIFFKSSSKGFYRKSVDGVGAFYYQGVTNAIK